MLDIVKSSRESLEATHAEVEGLLKQQQELEERKNSLVRELVEYRKEAIKEIDSQLAALGHDGKQPKLVLTKTRVCGNCGQSGHNARACSEPKNAKREAKDRVD